MSSSEPKKRKFDHAKKNKRFYMNMHRPKKFYIEAGQRGFLATCNFHEKECVRECYNLLNQYADELYGKQEFEPQKEGDTNDENDGVDDVADELERQINETNVQAKQMKFRFQSVDTQTNCCLFIKTILQEPNELGVKIARDIAASGQHKTRYLLRLLPVSIVCKANVLDIVEATAPLLDKYFLKEAHSFSIICNKRFNHSISKFITEIISELADLVLSKNAKNKVDLRNPEVSIVLEVMRGLCCVCILPDYFKLRKYNLVELATNSIDDRSNKLKENEVNVKKESVDIEDVIKIDANQEIAKTGINEDMKLTVKQVVESATTADNDTNEVNEKTVDVSKEIEKKSDVADCLVSKENVDDI